MSDLQSKLLISVVLITVMSCRFRDVQQVEPLARVGNNVLYINELKSIIPSGLSKEESLLVTEDYIRKWINKELLVKKAQENLTISQKELAKELEEYRNSLIIYRYQKELMDQKLDTVIMENELISFYDSVKKDFRQNVDLVKAISVRIPRRTFKPERVKAFCESSQPQNLKELEAFCQKNQGTFTLFLDQWVEPSVVFRNIPYHPVNIPGFIRQYTTWETRDTGHYYLVSIRDFSPEGGFTPVDYVRENIKEMILNKRKTEFLKRLEYDVYTEGLRNDKFKIYEYGNE